MQIEGRKMQARQIGIHQFMPDKIWKWKILEQKIGQHLYLHDYQEIRLSILQNHDVIQEGLTVLLEKEEAKRERGYGYQAPSSIRGRARHCAQAGRNHQRATSCGCDPCRWRGAEILLFRCDVPP